MNHSRGGRRNNEAGDEVEQLLQAAQDELLLKLSVDSHVSRVSPDYLLPDLDRRFQALKSRPTATRNQSSSTLNPQPPPPPPPPIDDDKDLFARFAALKASSSSSNSAVTAAVFDRDFGGESDDEEDEAEKIIRWAKDAARLDPSPSTVDSDDTDGEDDELDTVAKRE